LASRKCEGDIMPVYYDFLGSVIYYSWESAKTINLKKTEKSSKQSNLGDPFKNTVMAKAQKQYLLVPVFLLEYIC